MSSKRAVRFMLFTLVLSVGFAGCATGSGGGVSPGLREMNSCYRVIAESWDAAVPESYPEARAIGIPSAIYLGSEVVEHDLEPETFRGVEVDLVREALWAAPVPYRHIHWWILEDGSYRIGYRFAYYLWLGFEGARTDDGFEGRFRFWSHSGPAVDWGPAMLERPAKLERASCEEPEFEMLIRGT